MPAPLTRLFSSYNWIIPRPRVVTFRVLNRSSFRFLCRSSSREFHRFSPSSRPQLDITDNMAAQNMFLYWGSGSVPCWKAMIAIEEKGFTGYPNKLLSFANKEHKSPEIVALNPRGQLPTFKDGDTVVCESQAISEYLELAYPDHGTRLIPADKKERALVLQRANESSNVTKTLIEGVFVYKFHTEPAEFSEAVMAERRVAASTELDFWESYIQKQGPDGYIAGKNFSLADVMFFPPLAFAVRLGLELHTRPGLEKYYQRVVGRKSVQASWPPHWRDSEGDKSVFKGV